MGRNGYARPMTGRDKVIPANATLELGARERECIVLIADGLTYGEIGAQLGISPETAKMHAGRAYRKLGARNAAHAVALWLRREAGIRRAA